MKECWLAPKARGNKWRWQCRCRCYIYTTVYPGHAPRIQKQWHINFIQIRIFNMISEYPSSVKLIQLCTGATNGHTHGRKNLINYDFKLEPPPSCPQPKKDGCIEKKNRRNCQISSNPAPLFSDTMEARLGKWGNLRDERGNPVDQTITIVVANHQIVSINPRELKKQ